MVVRIRAEKPAPSSQSAVLFEPAALTQRRQGARAQGKIKNFASLHLSAFALHPFWPTETRLG
jgi:hypothetical protein